MGKKRSVNDVFLGSLTSDRVRDRNLRKDCTWYANYSVENTPEPITIIIEGNGLEPHKFQLAEVKNILGEIDLFYDKIDERLSKEIESMNANDQILFKDWRSYLYLSAIYSLNENSREPKFEICFSPFNEESFSHLILNYSNGKLEVIEFSGG